MVKNNNNSNNPSPNKNNIKNINNKTKNNNTKNNNAKNNEKQFKNNGKFSIISFFFILVLLFNLVLFDSEISNLLSINLPIFYKEYYYPLRIKTIENYKILEINFFENLQKINSMNSNKNETVDSKKIIKLYDYSFDELKELEQISINKLDNGEWNYFQWGSYVADQGSIIKDKNGYLRVDSNLFSGGVSNSFTDHVKLLAVNGHGFEIPENGSLSVTFTVRSKQINVENHPFGEEYVKDPQSDYRLANGILNVLDFNSMVVADFVITNKMIYALYERLPMAKDRLGDYASFIYVIPALNVENDYSFNDLTVTFNKQLKTIEWSANGKQVLYLENVGHLLPADKYKQNLVLYRGGTEQSIFPDQVNICFGSMTLLDATLIEGNNKTGLVFLDDAETGKYFNPLNFNEELHFFNKKSDRSLLTFNQGNILDIKKIKVETN